MDFKRCFDFISHQLLWQKLTRLGVSTKILKTIISLYSQACFTVRTPTGHSNSAEVSEGVLQGEILSPLLFNLFVADMEEFFRRRGRRGLSITHKRDLLILMYADDTAIIGYSEGDCQRKLKDLEDYCEENHIEVNVKKTEIMISSWQHRNSSCDFLFLYRGELVKIVDQYTYLGVIIQNNGRFNLAADQANKKGTIATGPLWEILKKGKCANWNRRMKLFNSLVMSCLTYGAEIWGFNECHRIEKVQLKFLRRSFGVSPFTPSYALRLEAGRSPVEITVYKMMLRFWLKILNMEPDRTPRQLFMQLKKKSNSIPLESNWALQVKYILQQADMEPLWEESDPSIIARQLQSIITRLTLQRWEEDWNFARTSTSSYYKQFTRLLATEAFISSHQNYRQMKTMAQLRLSSKSYPFIISGNDNSVIIDPKTTCACCNLNSHESLEHIIFICPQYESSRSKLLYRHLSQLLLCDSAELIDIIKDPSPELVRDMYLFVSSTLKIRRFLREE